MEFIFLLALFLPILVAAFLVKALYERHRRGNRPLKLWAMIMVLAILWNPIGQAFMLEPLDNMRGAALNKQSHMAGIIGMDEDRVRALFGEPSRVLVYPGVTTWEYKQIPGYWLGSYFQVFFKSGAVYGVEPNDD